MRKSGQASQDFIIRNKTDAPLIRNKTDGPLFFARGPSASNCWGFDQRVTAGGKFAARVGIRTYGVTVAVKVAPA